VLGDEDNTITEIRYGTEGEVTELAVGKRLLVIGRSIELEYNRP
jgi:hypothetical protein